MEKVGECKLCGTSNLSDKNFKLIDEFIKQVFDVILLKLTFDDTTQEVVCEICFSKLSKAFDFKSACLEIEDIIFPYVNSEISKAIDLKEIYAMEKIHKQESEFLKDCEICRLCFQPINSKMREIQDVPLEIIQIYIPEINFAVTTNASICTKCFESLYVHSTFLKSCSIIDDKTNILSGDILATSSCIKTEEIKSTNPFIKTEQIKIKSEEIEEEGTFFEILPNFVKKEEIEEGNACIHSLDGGTEDAVTNVPSSMTNYVKFENSFENHESDLSQVETQNWDECKFEMKYNKLVQHRPIHTNSSDVEIFKCDKCKYESKCRKYFLRHELIHRDSSELHKCDKCTYETKFKNYLVQHQLIHKDASELKMFKCDKCDYESKRKKNLLQHRRIHNNASEAEVFKCDKCKFETKHRRSYANHQMRHKDPSKLQMYSCDKCTYESRFKNYLTKHQVIHKDASEVKMFKCDKCKFESKWQKCLLQHQLIHKKVFEVKMFKCDKCKYEAKWKKNLLRHQLIHRDPPEEAGVINESRW